MEKINFKSLCEQYIKDSNETERQIKVLKNTLLLLMIRLGREGTDYKNDYCPYNLNNPFKSEKEWNTWKKAELTGLMAYCSDELLGLDGEYAHKIYNEQYKQYESLQQLEAKKEQEERK